MKQKTYWVDNGGRPHTEKQFAIKSNIKSLLLIDSKLTLEYDRIVKEREEIVEALQALGNEMRRIGIENIYC